MSNLFAGSEPVVPDSPPETGRHLRRVSGHHMTARWSVTAMGDERAWEMERVLSVKCLIADKRAHSVNQHFPMSEGRVELIGRRIETNIVKDREVQEMKEL